ncbi:MAG: hypothetical protein WBX05_03500 [Pseudolabrys sp.]
MTVVLKLRQQIHQVHRVGQIGPERNHFAFMVAATYGNQRRLAFLRLKKDDAFYFGPALVRRKIS